MRREHVEPDTKMPKDIVPGDVIGWGDEHAVVVSNEYPAGSVPARSLGYEGPNPAEDYCEPGLVIIKHQRDDRWVRTHVFTYTLLPVRQRVHVYNAFRVQEGYKRGRFLKYEERTRQTS